MTNCPCCSDRLLQHIYGHEIHWFCRTCWQEMPVLSEEKCSLHSEEVIGNLPTKLQKEKRDVTAYVPTKQTKVAQLKLKIISYYPLKQSQSSLPSKSMIRSLGKRSFSANSSSTQTQSRPGMYLYKA